MTAFESGLDLNRAFYAEVVGPIVARDPVARERALAALFEAAAAEHNATMVSDPVDPTVRPYHSREFQVLLADRFADACIARVSDPWLRTLPLIGSVDQFVDSTDVLQYPDRVNRLATFYADVQTRSLPSGAAP